MKAQLYKTKNAVKVKVRWYPVHQGKRLRVYLDRLEDLRYISPNPKTACQAAPHLVLKDSTKLRVTPHWRPVNLAKRLKHGLSETYKLSSPILQRAQTSRNRTSVVLIGSLRWSRSHSTLAEFSPSKGYTRSCELWMAQKYHRAHSSSCTPWFSSIQHVFKAYLSDFIIYAKSRDELLKYLYTFLDISCKREMKLSAKKCRIYMTNVKCCCQIITDRGSQMDPATSRPFKPWISPQLLINYVSSYIAGDRWQQLTAISIEFHNRRMRFSKMPMQNADKMQETALRWIALSRISWGEVHKEPLLQLKESLKNVERLAQLKYFHVIAVFTNASEKFLAEIVTKVDEDDTEKDVQ